MKKLKEWEKTFIKIMIGQSISLITSSIVQYAIIWYITYTTTSAFWLSIATLVGFLPQGILGLFIGSYIDKNNRKKIMIYSDLFIAITSLLMIIYGLYNDLPLWLILVCLGLRSIGTAFHTPSLQASIPLVVPEEKFLKYSGYNQALQSLSLIVSPAIASLLYGKMNLPFIIMIDVVGALFAIGTLVVSVIPNPTTETSLKTKFLKETKEGIKLIINNKVINYIFIISAFYAFLYMPISSLFPLLTISYFKKTAFDAGIIETIFAVGMLISGIVIAKTNLFQSKRKNIIVSILMMGIAVFISGTLLENMFWIFTVLSFIMGFSGPIIQATISAIFAEQVSPDYLGRIYSNYMSLTILIIPIGLLVSGMLVDIVQINNWFLITGLLITILSFCIMIHKISFDIKKSNIK